MDDLGYWEGDLDEWESDQEAVRRALAERLEEAGVLRYERRHGERVWYLYERTGVRRVLQLPKGMNFSWKGIRAQRIYIDGKWRLMYTLAEIEHLLSESPTLEGQAHRRQGAEHWLEQALLIGCKDIGLEGTKELINAFFRDLINGDLEWDDFKSDEFKWDEFKWDDLV
jgi:hypothetical protein